MGQRGPKPLPSNIHLLRNNASKKSLASLLDDVVRPPVEAPECPAHLEGEARAEWDRIVPHLLSLGLVSQIDRAALTFYCDTWADYVNATNHINLLNDVARTKLAVLSAPEVPVIVSKEIDGKIIEVKAWLEARVTKTPSGYEQISVLMQIRNRAIDQCRQFLAPFGLSPADRSRVTQSDPQLGLPEIGDKPKAGGWAEFG